MPQNWPIVFPFNPFILRGMKPLNIPVVAAPDSMPSGRRKNASRPHEATKARVATTNSPARDVALPPLEDDGVLCAYVTAISRLDQAALKCFYDLTVSRVYSVALRIVRHAHLAEEVVSDVYMQVWRDAARYDATRGRVLGWLLIIARSRALDLLRRQDEAFSHPEPYDLISEPESEQKSAHDLMTDTEAGNTLRAAIETLTPLQRQLLSLAFFRGLSHAEIVEHSGIPLGSVKTHIRRALALLRSELGQDLRLND